MEATQLEGIRHKIGLGTRSHWHHAPCPMPHSPIHISTRLTHERFLDCPKKHCVMPHRGEATNTTTANCRAVRFIMAAASVCQLRSGKKNFHNSLTKSRAAKLHGIPKINKFGVRVPPDDSTAAAQILTHYPLWIRVPETSTNSRTFSLGSFFLFISILFFFYFWSNFVRQKFW